MLEVELGVPGPLGCTSRAEVTTGSLGPGTSDHSILNGQYRERSSFEDLEWFSKFGG